MSDISNSEDTCKGCGESLSKHGMFDTVVREYVDGHGWANVGIPTCSNCHTMTRWESNLYGDDIPRDVEDLKQYTRDHRSHFFDPDTMRFFGSRIAPGITVYAGRVYFITSERGSDVWDDKRRYTVRYMTAGANFFEVPKGGFGAYASLRAARKALAEAPTCAA